MKSELIGSELAGTMKSVGGRAQGINLQIFLKYMPFLVSLNVLLLQLNEKNKCHFYVAQHNIKLVFLSRIRL